MKIIKDTVVTFKYVLQNEEGAIVEAPPSQPTVYLHGYHQIMPMIEQALAQKGAGDKIEVFIPYDKAYGKRNPDFIKVIPRSHFAQPETLKIGMKVYPSENRDFMIKIVEISGDEVTIDANHPLAEINLKFLIEVLEVRQATEAELKLSK